MGSPLYKKYTLDIAFLVRVSRCRGETLLEVTFRGIFREVAAGGEGVGAVGVVNASPMPRSPTPAEAADNAHTGAGAVFARSPHHHAQIPKKLFRSSTSLRAEQLFGFQA
jgi:hypothetical protein